VKVFPDHPADSQSRLEPQIKVFLSNERDGKGWRAAIFGVELGAKDFEAAQPRLVAGLRSTGHQEPIRRLRLACAMGPAAKPNATSRR
jgi:hypothetical protein